MSSQVGHIMLDRIQGEWGPKNLLHMARMINDAGV